MTEKIKEIVERCPWREEKPVPTFELTSLRDKIKRTSERLEELNKREAAPEVEPEEHDGFEIVRNTALDRLQIIFDDIPDAETRQALKSNGFRWSPSNKAWQRQLTDHAERAARQILKLA